MRDQFNNDLKRCQWFLVPIAISRSLVLHSRNKRKCVSMAHSSYLQYITPNWLLYFSVPSSQYIATQDAISPFSFHHHVSWVSYEVILLSMECPHLQNASK